MEFSALFAFRRLLRSMEFSALLATSIWLDRWSSAPVCHQHLVATLDRWRLAPCSLRRLAMLDQQCLHIWDEFPMVHRNNFEAVNRCLCDIIGNDAPCGGWVFICCGDFRQNLPSFKILSGPLLTRPQRDAGDAVYSRFND